jgi:hypothetical protein
VRITEGAMKLAAPTKSTSTLYPLANSPSPQQMAELRSKPTRTSASECPRGASEGQRRGR